LRVFNILSPADSFRIFLESLSSLEMSARDACFSLSIGASVGLNWGKVVNF
jgi:hypothetical protein